MAKRAVERNNWTPEEESLAQKRIDATKRAQRHDELVRLSGQAMQAFIASELSRMGQKAPHEILIEPIVRESVRYGQRILEEIDKLEAAQPQATK